MLLLMQEPDKGTENERRGDDFLSWVVGPWLSAKRVQRVTVRKWERQTLLILRGPTVIKVKALSMTARAKGTLITLNSFKCANSSLLSPHVREKNYTYNHEGRGGVKGQEEGGTVHQPSPPKAFLMPAQFQKVKRLEKKEETDVGS